MKEHAFILFFPEWKLQPYLNFRLRFGCAGEIKDTVRFCSEHIPDQRLFGFMQTIWNPTIEQNRTRIMKAIELTGNTKKWFSENYSAKR